MKDPNWLIDLVVKVIIPKMAVYTVAIKLSDFIPLFMGKSIISVKNAEGLITD